LRHWSVCEGGELPGGADEIGGAGERSAPEGAAEADAGGTRGQVASPLERSNARLSPVGGGRGGAGGEGAGHGRCAEGVGESGMYLAEATMKGNRWNEMALAEICREDAQLRALDSYGEFSEEFIADVLDAMREAEMGLVKRFDDVEDLIADLLNK